MRQLLPRWLVVCLATLFVVATPFAEDVVITELVSPSYYTWTGGEAINASGQVAGWASNDGPPQHAMVWTNGVGVPLLGLCPLCNAQANDINDAGVVVGWSVEQVGISSHAVVWTNGVPSELPPLPGDTFASAQSINNLGDVVGISRANASAPSHVVRWHNGVPEDLGLGTANAINDAGAVLFNNRVRNPDGSFTNLDRIPECASFGQQAQGINEAGQVVGVVSAPVGLNGSCTTVGATWINGAVTILPPPNPARPQTLASDINEAGDIVGSAFPLSGPLQAVVWRDGSIIELGALPFAGGLVQSRGSDINDSGVVAGYSRLTTSSAFPQRTHTVTWTTARPNTPPTLTLPDAIVADATSGDGATVFFSATANDVEDGAFNATCAPSSGSAFSIGSTTVSCSATDSGGLSANGSFTVTVLGASEQAQNLVNDLGSSGPGTSLQNKLNGLFEGGDTLRAASLSTTTSTPKPAGNACAKLQSFINEVSAQSGKKLTAAQASSFIASAQRIRAVIGCR